MELFENDPLIPGFLEGSYSSLSREGQDGQDKSPRKEDCQESPVRRLMRPRGSYAVRIDPDTSLPPEIHKVKGVHVELGICRFIKDLLRTNEQLPKFAKMTDEQIARILQDEYPHSRNVIRLEGTKVVTYYRNHYNAGLLVPKEGKPILRSRRYAKSGLPVNGYTGRVLRGIKLMDMLEQIDREKRAEIERSSIGVRIKVSKPRHRIHKKTGKPEEGYAEVEEWKAEELRVEGWRAEGKEEELR